MTIAEIFKRYEIAETISENIIARTHFVRKLHENWVGIDLDWRALTRATLFYDFGDELTTKLVRKKVGVDKYVVNIISRAVLKRADEILQSKDFYHKITLLSALQFQNDEEEAVVTARDALQVQLEDNLIHGVDSCLTAISNSERQTILDIDIKHYKNPSV
jgi:hypothetical protein